MKRWFLGVVLGNLTLPSALGQTPLVATELRLSSLLDSLPSAKGDSLKLERNERFRSGLEKTLKDPASFTYPFDKLRSLGTIESPDNQIRIINWNLELDDQTQRYYCFVQKVDTRKKSVKLYELKEDIASYYRSEEVIDGQKWYGALYYQIIPVLRNNKTVYTVLGWDGHTQRSTVKLIDIMTISGNSIKFGAPLFKMNDKVKKRIFLEHSEQSTMTCRWENTQQRIVFDHLSPETPTLEGFYEFYVPDMSYDALEYQGNKWVLLEGIISVNSSSVQVKLNKISDSGEIEEEIVENKWIDPSKGGTTQNTHVAALPDREIRPDKKVAKAAPKTALDLYNEKKSAKSTTESNVRISKKKKRK